MIAYLIRFLKRIAVLIPGLIITYFAIHDIFPSLERRIPGALAILITYIVTAYVLIPFGSRLVRLIIKPKHIPLYSTSPDGFACDPVNVGVVGTREDLINAMAKAGWFQADRRTLKNVAKTMVSILFRKPYPTAPFSNLYLFGRSQDIGFQLPIGNNPSLRHHVRFWAAVYTTDPRFRDHVHFWQKHHKAEASDRILWVGAVSLDTGFGLIRQNAQVTHMIHPDTNAERVFIINELKKTGLIKKTRTVTAGLPYRTANRIWMSYMHADGKMVICELKPAHKASILRANARSRSVIAPMS